MNKLIKSLIPLFIITSQVFAIAGFGISANQSLFNVDASTSDLTLPDGSKVGSFSSSKYSNGYGLGGYLYIDVIPFIDIDIEGNSIISRYDFSFANPVDTLKKQIITGALSGYITAQKKLFKLSIPLLAKVKLTAGAGINFNISPPVIDQTMLESIIPTGKNVSTGTVDTKALIEYIGNNKNSSTGFHIQTGLQFKILMLDSFLYYRQVFADDVIPGAKGFGSLNLRLGMGF